jgi:hypothetical protein
MRAGDKLWPAVSKDEEICLLGAQDSGLESQVNKLFNAIIF